MKNKVIPTIALLASFAPVVPAARAAENAAQYSYAVQSPSDGVPATPVVYHRPRRYVRRNYYYSNRPRYVVKRRSKAKSAAIIGGSAAAGAGIGALAGGGKGAGIGAIAGGAAGLIYDRKTHKKVVRRY